MNSRERMLAALSGRVLDRLPVTTHHVMLSFLDRYMAGASMRDLKLDSVVCRARLH